ncbi:saccharopine dehydrogenase [Micromonospora sp. HNM0581]|uniref:saccharopine dehydrogenase n=1 Tax=Micromonospora sp. HNM0581 TaxID=2716341 RepID=UPI00146B6DC4|nr:saccharopine dehydrogenase [Micromonospora sp. HNM0581]NLU80656.1 saccharopine dehydrogenase [Micromonospora sp. HNM0581]
MMHRPRLWIRAETRSTEQRVPIVPADAGRLVRAGFTVTVEESPQRVFPLAAYAAVGCRTAPAGTWVDADTDQFVVGLKELSDQPEALRHRHIYFGHAYKEQRGAARLLSRFTVGGGRLLDLEYLVDGAGRRLAAFGYWAGYVGAAVAVLHLRGTLHSPLVPITRSALDAELRAGARSATGTRALVVGALGRCGRGARDALEVAGIAPTCWDLAETRDLDLAALLSHDLLVNAVLAIRPVPPFVTPEDLAQPRRLRTIVDVSCDVGSPCNVLPIYDRPTTWGTPVARLRSGQVPVDLIAIDNLPSLLPLEASESFSAELTPLLTTLEDPSGEVWRRCQETFDRQVTRTRKMKESTVG